MQEYIYNYDPEFTPETAFRTIWTRPWPTLLNLLRYYPQDYVWLLFYLGGLAKAIDRAMTKNMGDTTPIVMIFLMAAVIGAPMSMFLFNIYSGLLSWTGRWLKGTATQEECRTVLAWSLVPSISSLLLLVPGFALFGGTLFTSEAMDDTVLYIIFVAADIVLVAWTVRTFTIGLMIVQGFGRGMAILNMLLAGGVILACILGVALLFSMLF